MSLRIIDMAGTVDLLKDADGKMGGKTTVVKVTEKSPGAGADTTVSFVMQMFVMAMSHISLTQEVKEMASTVRDTMHKQVSKMSYALFQGSGVLVNSKREIMSSTFQSEISNNGHFTELFKNDDDQLAWIESLMTHSGDVQVGAQRRRAGRRRERRGTGRVVDDHESGEHVHRSPQAHPRHCTHRQPPRALDPRVRRRGRPLDARGVEHTGQGKRLLHRAQARTGTQRAQALAARALRT
jgi:hypothetical protein